VSRAGSADGDERGPSSRERNATLELGLSLLVIAGGFVGLVPYSTTPFLLLIGVLFLRLEGRDWRDLGLERPARLGRTLALGIGAGFLLQLGLIVLVAPLVERLTGARPDLGPLAEVQGNARLLALYLVVVWLLAAFGEELVYRGTLARRVALLAGGGESAWRASLVLVNLLFAAGHASQGLAGVLLNGLAGFGLAHVFRRSGRNLWAPILAHGTFNTIGLVLLYLGAGQG
jgi:hypothetical protein